MGAFLGTLNTNEIFAALYNMIIGQEVFADNLGKHQTLVDEARIDGGLHSDTKLYYATDALKSYAWGNDAEAANLLALARPASPACQKIVLDQFRQIRLTVDNYLTKRAFADEGSFSQFNGVMLGWIRETKKVYDGTTYNVFIGTNETNIGAQEKTITLTGTNDGQTIAKAIADILVEMGDYNRDYNDYGFLRSYADADIKIIWNAEYVNKINKQLLPTIFHKEGLVDKMDKYVLPKKYFGIVITTANIATYTGQGKVLDANSAYDPTKGKVRCVAECEKTIGGTTYHYFAGDEIKTGATVKVAGNFLPGEVYIEDATIMCKIVTKLPPYMSAFEVGTSFFNPRALTETHYLTFGHNTIEAFKAYPFITVRKA